VGINYDDVMGLTSRRQVSWTERDAIIYALGVGMADDPMDERELPFVREGSPKVVPTFPVVVGFGGGALAKVGLDYRQVLHGEQAVTLYRPFPAEGTAIAEGRMIGAWDKGPGKGAVFAEERRLLLANGEPLASVVTTAFGRAEGGFGGPSSGQPKPHVMPARAPDDVIEIDTLPKQALLYRLSGDLNPLHINPASATASGFPRPILHGLCTFAICCRGVLMAYCDYDPTRIRHHQARFSAPVFPGERIRIELWRDGDTVSFQAHVPAREAVVIKSGKAIISAS
jgi:acyl dehydratase